MARNPAAFPSPMRTGKVVRWFSHLTEAQLVELSYRVCRAVAGGGDVEPEQLRQVYITFAEEMPHVARV